MSWLDDALEIFSGTRGSSSSSSTATTSTNVTVNPTILNSIDTTPLAQPLQNLVDAMTLGTVTSAVVAQRQGEALERSAAMLASAQGQETKISELAALATWVSLGVAVIKLWK